MRVPTVAIPADLACVVGAVSACPQLPPVAGCRVGAYACRDGAPAVCSSSLRWEPIGDRSCPSVGAVCVAPTDGPAHCARAQSDAAADAPDASDGGAE